LQLKSMLEYVPEPVSVLNVQLPALRVPFVDV